MNLKSLFRKIVPEYRWAKFPQVIQVDTSNLCGKNVCGIQCTYCFPMWQVANKVRGYKLMPMEWIEWIIDQVRLYGKGHMGFIDYFLNGDALTDLRLPKIYRISKRECPWLPTTNFTNGILTDNIDLILDRNLDTVSFTVSAHNRDLYKAVHGGDMFDSVIKTMDEYFERKPPHQKAEIHCVITKDNYEHLHEWWSYFSRYPAKRFLSPLVASYANVPSREALGDLTLEMQERKVIEIAGEEGRMWTTGLIPHGKPCVLWDNLSIDVEGALMNCCNWYPVGDWNYGYVQDYINEGRTLKEAWTERLANRMRNPVCRSCNMKAPDWEARLSKMRLEASR